MKSVEEIYDQMLVNRLVISRRDLSGKMGRQPNYYHTVGEKVAVGPLMVLWQYLQDRGAYGLAGEVFQIVQEKSKVRGKPRGRHVCNEERAAA